MGDDIRVQGGFCSGKMKELVFNSKTGEFVTKSEGSSPSSDEMKVTNMTHEGWACDMPPIVYANMGELKSFFNSPETIIIGRAYEWENENVIHLHTAPLHHSWGIVHETRFCKGEASDYQPDTFVMEISGSVDDLHVRGYYINHENEKLPLIVQFIPAKVELHSRNKGILERDVLMNKRVLIIGLGSFGSHIAIEMVKAGVGQVSFFDDDRVELHNLVRHIATVHDLGRLKTDVVEEAVKGKNPYVKVDKFPVNINEHLALLEEEVEKADIVICATDNNESRFNLSSVLVKKQKIGIFGRAVTRAEGGDVFIYRPGGPCYCCLIGNQWFEQAQEEITNVASARRNGQIAAYVSAEDADAVVQVGLSADIEPICNMMVKIALMELSRGTQSGISCLEDELVYDYYMWANRRERRHKNWAPMPNAGNQPTIMRWYGARISKDENCCLCSNHDVKLDEGEGVLNICNVEMENTDLSNVTPEE